jgi:4-hydroxy-tetrahydrodipicolinate synthase
VTANVAPQQCAAFQDAWVQGDMDKFNQIQSILMPLHKALFVESSPAPIKYAASVLGLCRDEVRLPLVAASAKARAAVDEAMLASGLINSTEAVKRRSHG